MRTVDIYRAFHQALHHTNTSSVEVEGQAYPVEQTRGKRYIRYQQMVFAQQDSTQKTPLARRARTEPITRIVRTGRKWGWISDNEIADPLLDNNNPAA